VRLSKISFSNNTESLKKFLFRFFIVFAVVGLIYAGYYFISKKQNKSIGPDVSKSSLSVKLTEHTLAISALQNIDPYDPSTPYKIEGLRSVVDSTLSAYKDEFSKYNELAKGKDTDNLDDFYDQENLVLSEFDNVYSNLKKLTIYSLEKDIGRLNPVADSNEIKTRLGISIEQMERVKSSSNYLSNKSKVAIAKTVVCMQKIEQKVPKNTDSLKESIEECDQLQLAASKSITKDILSSLDNDRVESLISNLSSKASQLRQ
jgi:hypothetical protein